MLRAQHRAQEALKKVNLKRRGKASEKQFRRFPEWTSMLALPQVVYFRSFCSLFWGLVFLAAVAIFIWQLVVIIDNYSSFQYSVIRTLIFSNFSFPAVTACDMNPYKRDLAYQNEEIKNLMETFDYLVAKLYNNDSLVYNSTYEQIADEYSLSNYTSSMTLLAQMSTILTMTANTFNLTAASAQYDDFIQGCSFNLQDCQSGDWTVFYSENMGTCYTFNLAGDKNVSRVGPIYGLRLILKSNVSQYLPVTSMEGFKVYAHHQQEYPFPDIYGVDVMVGGSANLGVTFTQVARLSEPYSPCVHEDEKPDFYNYPLNYSTEGCMRSVYQADVVINCGCYDPTYLRPTNNTFSGSNDTLIDTNQVVVCTTGDYSCILTQREKNYNANCTQPCYESTYSVDVSSSKWPSGSSTAIGTCENGDYGNQTCVDMYAENGAFVQVYFEAQSYESVEEVLDYSFSSFLSDFGGTLGLWIGGSILVIIEVTLLVVQCTMAFCCPRSGRLIGY
ncbi:unnamed protein product [Bursaphelenchus okinawaensis]|uniref:Uncharacterized protein n=1 Tax=Bursaphelenchus okinawaensis TaxID=465554 RepID=A0A811KM14_9BILA|nr:unnamed protein product [Bursaphelenchus okinawaensis]CAG9105752.1 unnamed protein product [Bursaphelenchus okinawaensis]